MIDGGLLWAAVTGVLLAAHPEATARWLGLATYPWTNRLFEGGLALALGGLCVLAARWILLLGRISKRLKASRHPQSPLTCSRGTLVVEFALVLPLVGLMFVMIIQLALLANAALVVRHAAFASARTAIVRTERSWSLDGVPKARPRADGDGLEVYYEKVLGAGFPFLREQLPSAARDDVRKAAHLLLATISPVTERTSDAEALALGALHAEQARLHAPHSWGSSSLERRVTYASVASQIDITELLDTDTAGDAPSYATSMLALAYLEKAVEELIGNVVDQVYGVIPWEARIVLDVSGIGGILKDLLTDGIKGILWPIVESALRPVFDQLLPFLYGPIGFEVKVTYLYHVPLPGIQLIPGATEPAPAPYSGRVFPITATAWLQTTGPRQSHPIVLLDLMDGWILP